MRPKLEDVAKLANVSKTTVSRVLNNRGYLSQETIDRVYQAVKELNYQPNVVARQLYKSKHASLGFCSQRSLILFGELSAELEKKAL